MKNKRPLVLILITVIAVCAVLIGLWFAGRFANTKKYEKMTGTATAETTVTAAPETKQETAATTAEETTTAEADFLKKIDFTALKQRNSDVVAWIYIPGTDPEISYPVMWKENDNDYYLHRDIDQKKSYEGVFLDGADKPDFSSSQNLIYGHHMKNGTMFAGLAKFKEESYFNAHRWVYLYTPERTYRLRAFSCAYTDSGPERRRTVFADKTEFDAYVDSMTDSCTFRQIPTGGIDRLFALVTCSYEYNNARTILYCYESDLDGNPVRDRKAWSVSPTAPAASFGTAASGTSTQ